jgi:cytochrome oxidase Cu insertion factor (SCO1/SenC/PrrC family)
MASNRGVVDVGPGQVEVQSIELPKLVDSRGRRCEHGADSRDDRIRLLSISFDPLRDDARALRGYATQHHSDPTRWIVAAPKIASDLHRLERETGTVVIDDGLGGYTHNAAIHVVVADGRLVRIFDFNQPEAALACARNLWRTKYC